MKSVGEVMAMGRTFQESIQKALQMEEDLHGFEFILIVLLIKTKHYVINLHLLDQKEYFMLPMQAKRLEQRKR